MKTTTWIAAFVLALTACEDPSLPDGDGGGGSGVGAGAIGGGGAGGDEGGGGGGGIATCPEGSELIDVAGKVGVDVLVNGAGPFLFILDTGAPTTVIDDSVDARTGDTDLELAFGGKVTTLDNAYVLNLADYGIPADGVIGTDVLGTFALSIDYQRERVWLDDAIDEPTLQACAHAGPDAATVDMVVEDHFFVEGSLEGEAGWFLVDTGASLGLVPEDVFADLEAASPRPSLGGFYTPAAIGTFWARLSSLGTMEVAGAGVYGVLTRTAPAGLLPDLPARAPGRLLGLLPSGYFRHFLVTVDYPASKLRLAGYVGDSFVEPRTRTVAGIGLEEIEDPPLHVTEVLAGSSAEELGVQVGDELTAIGGQPIADLTAYSRPWALTSSTGAESVTIDVLRATETFSFTIELRDLLLPPAR